MNDNETIADIVREMLEHAKDGEFVNGYEVGRLAERIEAAYKRLAIPTPEQWTEFARQGSENYRLRTALKDIMKAIRIDSNGFVLRHEREYEAANYALYGGET